MQIRQYMLRFCLELTKKQFVKNSVNLKLLKIEIFQGGRTKKYFVYFKTDNEEKAYFQQFQASSDYFVSANIKFVKIGGVYLDFNTSKGLAR